MSEWKPIETAPRDGSIILLGNYGSEPRPAYYGRALKAFNACAEPRFPWVFLDATNGINAMSDDEFGPTHWMPLPAPPVEAKSEVVESSPPRWEVGKNGWDASDEATREDI